MIQGVFMNQELISVIIPAYNEEEKLSRCVDSILNQTYTNLEIILVDDGSKDKTPIICDEYQAKDERIRVIHQENKGLSDARNAGLEIATGEYIVFIDSDDITLKEMIEKLYHLLKEYDADISVCQFQNFTDEIPEITQPEEKITIYEGDKRYQAIWDSWALTCVQWNKLFKRKIFADLRFPSGKYHEDEYVIHKEIHNARKIVYTNQIYYLYSKQGETITNTPSLKKFYHALEGFHDRLDFFDELGYTDFSRKSYNQIMNYISSVKVVARNLEDTDAYLKRILLMEHDLKNRYSKLTHFKWYLLRKKENFPIYMRIKKEELLNKLRKK